MALLHTIIHPSRLHDIKFCKRVNGSGELLFAAAEDKKLSVYAIPDDPESTDPLEIIAEMIGHQNRVKAVETLSIALPESSNTKRTSTTIVCTISSDGKIFVYDLASLPASSSSSSSKIIQLEPKAEYDTKGTRLTCVALADGDVVTESVNGKRKRTVTDETLDEGVQAEDEEWPRDVQDGVDVEECEAEEESEDAEQSPSESE